MKLFSALVLAFLLPIATFAAPTPELEAVDVFLNDPGVQAAIADRQVADPTLKLGTATAVALKGGCGFAGCDTTYLVVQTLRHHGTNTYFQSVTAVVTVRAVGAPSVSTLNVF